MSRPDHTDWFVMGIFIFWCALMAALAYAVL
jgi:hypothetical protein